MSNSPTVPKTFWNENIPLFFFLLAYTLLICCSFSFPFFWDNIVQASAIAHYYYQTGFSTFFLPDNLDPGHPPFFGMLLAFLWKLVGKQLWVGHLMMLPFVWGIVCQINVLVTWCIDPRWKWWAIGILLSDPTLVAQCTQVSPDIAMVFFFLLGIRGILKQQPVYISIACLGVLLFNLRGMVLCSELFILHILYNILIIKKINLKQLVLVFIPSIIFVLTYYGVHFLEKGWIRYHAQSNWETKAEFVDIRSFFKNITVTGWRILDFGRVFVWVSCIVVGMKIDKNKFVTSEKIRVIVLSFTCSCILVLLLLLSSEFILHRYLINLYLLFSLLTCYALFELWNGRNKLKKWVSFAFMIALWTGHLWSYPIKMSVGWDATLAHVPYFSVYRQMLHVIKEELKISPSRIGSAFPNDLPTGIALLTDDTSRFPEKNLPVQEYILYSNVFNDFTNEEIDELQERWIPVKELSKGNIVMILYRRRVFP